ncbi:MAG: MBL fold metallo-hydrolase [Verrucomicrobiales bacterium]|nr:MBL fold metallo-hydrolase [Verrucomicrobiales bacterium]
MKSEIKIRGYTGGMFQTNGYHFQSGDGFSLLIDAPEGIADWLSGEGESVDALFLTHLHHDHVLDVAALKEQFDCPVYAHSSPTPDLTLEALLRANMPFIPDVPEFEVDHLLAGESALDLSKDGGPILKLIHVPGHSPDSLCAQPDDVPVLFGGDVLFQNGIGRTDFPHGDEKLLLSGIREKLFCLPDETEVLPGHGPPTRIGFEKSTNPFLQVI